jgi:hypothetical protein
MIVAKATPATALSKWLQLLLFFFERVIIAIGIVALFVQFQAVIALQSLCESDPVF